MNYEITSDLSSRELVISVAEIKQHLRIDTTAEDALLESIIQAATRYCEQYANTLFVEAEVLAKYRNFYRLFVPVMPVRSIDSVKYYDTDNELQTLDSSKYEMSDDQIIEAYDCEWPDVRNHEDSVEVTYTAGLSSDAAGVPTQIKQAIKLVCGHFYESREDTTTVSLEQIPIGAKSLLNLSGRKGLI